MEVKVICEPCKEREIGSYAYKYCVTCQESQCRKCAEVHKSYKATRSHHLVQIEDWQVPLKLCNDLKVMRKCKQHAEKELEFCCTDHKEFLCSTCLLTESVHRHCTTIINLSTCFPSSNMRVFTDKICNDLDQTIHKARYAKEKLIGTYENSKSITKQISDKVNTMRDNFLMQFEQQKSIISSSAKEKVKRQAENCTKKMACIDDLISSAKESEKFLKKMKDLGRDSDIVHCILLSIEKTEELKRQTEEICSESTELEVEFGNTVLTDSVVKNAPLIKCNIKETKLAITDIKLDTTSKEDLYYHIYNTSKTVTVKDTTESSSNVNDSIKTTGDKSKREHPMSVTLLENKSTDEDEENSHFNSDKIKRNSNSALKITQDTPQSADTTNIVGTKGISQSRKESATYSPDKKQQLKESPVQLRYSECFNIKDEDCSAIWVGGIVCLHDNRLVLSDYLNMRLMVLNTDHQVCQVVPIRNGPRYVSMFNQDTFIVCLIKCPKIVLMKIKNADVKVGNYLQTRFYPKTAHSSGSNSILVTMQDDDLVWHVDVIDLSGKVLQTVKIKEFFDGYRTAVLKPETQDSRTTLIQYCRYSEEVRFLSLDGKLVFRFKIDEVSSVFTDNIRRNIIIVRYCGEVLVLSSDGKLKARLKKMSMYRANYLAMNASLDKVYITTYKEPKIHTLKVCCE